jgi:hypothetical protein
MEFYNYIRFFTIYSVFCMFLLNIRLGLSEEILHNIMVSIYLIAFISISYVRDYRRWIDIFKYTICLALFFTIPEWCLSEKLKVLTFIDTTGAIFGQVPIFLVGMWVISLFMILYSATIFNDKFKNKFYLILFLFATSFLVFVLSDEMISQIQLWYYHDVQLFGRLPIFMILPNFVLGVSIFFSYNFVKEKPIYIKVIMALGVMLLRLSLIIISYHLIE